MELTFYKRKLLLLERTKGKLFWSGYPGMAFPQRSEGDRASQRRLMGFQARLTICDKP